MQSDKDAADLVFAREDVTDSRDSGADLAAPESQGQPRDENGRFAPKSEPAQAQATPPVEAQPTPPPEGLQPETQPEPARVCARASARATPAQSRRAVPWAWGIGPGATQTTGAHRLLARCRA